MTYPDRAPADCLADLYDEMLDNLIRFQSKTISHGEWWANHKQLRADTRLMRKAQREAVDRNRG